MDIEAKIDFKDLKKQKNKNKKKFKKAVKKFDYDTIQECLTFLKKYDEMVNDGGEKYEKYFFNLPPQTREIIMLRKSIADLKNIDLTIYEIFEKRLSDKLTTHINGYVERRLIQMKKQLVNANKQVQMKQPKRVKAAPKKHKLNIT